MKNILIAIALLFQMLPLVGQEVYEPDFKWGNSLYVNLNVGDIFVYEDVSIKLLNVENHYNWLQIDSDTVKIKVSRRTLPIINNKVRIFVADNKHVKQLSADKNTHALLKKDALICVSQSGQKMFNSNEFYFPVSFYHGFSWNATEDSYMFSYNTNTGDSYKGIGIDLHDARGLEKHWLVAMENSTVVWVEDKNLDPTNKQACVLLASDSSPGIYYVYDRLYNKNLEVKSGQKLLKGELIGTAWGEAGWGYLQLAVIKSDTIPSYENRFHNCVNFFPQLYEIYFSQSFSLTKSFTKGSMQFGRRAALNRNCKNNFCFEEYSGRGWDLGAWCTPDKVDTKSKKESGNVRLQKKMFEGTKAACMNPGNFYDYHINVRNGVYRIRVKVGDVTESSWQKIEFEGVYAGTYSLQKGEQVWTNEKVVKVTDRKLTLRVYIDEKQNKIAGISDVVFQKAY